MPNVWENDGPGWVRRPLTETALSLVATPRAPGRPEAEPSAAAPGVTMRRYGDSKAALWVLIRAGVQGVRVNGAPVLAGLWVLHDRDEILIEGHTRLYYSTEELAKVEPFPGGEGPVFCARCRQSIQPGTPAVRCPACGCWCEQTESKPCWTYGQTCPMCEQPTALDTGLRWTPEDL